MAAPAVKRSASVVGTQVPVVLVEMKTLQGLARTEATRLKVASNPLQSFPLLFPLIKFLNRFFPLGQCVAHILVELHLLRIQDPVVLIVFNNGWRKLLDHIVQIGLNFRAFFAEIVGYGRVYKGHEEGSDGVAEFRADFREADGHPGNVKSGKVENGEEKERPEGETKAENDQEHGQDGDDKEIRGNDEGAKDDFVLWE